VGRDCSQRDDRCQKAEVPQGLAPVLSPHGPPDPADNRAEGTTGANMNK
jgi:hypothetical protein